MTRTVSVACGILALSVAGPAAAELPAGVVKSDNFYDAAVVGDHVWVIGFPGLILHSADRGATFESQGPGGREALFAADFADARTGWVSGRGGLVLATTDGGKTWTRQETGTTEPLLGIDFADAATGIAVGNFAAGVRTTDGGRTWAAIRPAPEGEDPSFNGVAFLPDGKGVVVVGEFGTAFVSEDAGATWTKVETGESDSLYGVAATPAGAIVAAGAGGVITVSTDRGKTWQRAASGTERHLFRVTVAGDRVLVAGNGGLVLSATDPAADWKQTRLPTYLWVGSARLDAGGKGVAVGARGLLVLTSDGGKTWKTWGGAP
jgi:photosystem II stability/assembly factor-like uncharacterized protein